MHIFCYKYVKLPQAFPLNDFNRRFIFWVIVDGFCTVFFLLFFSPVLGALHLRAHWAYPMDCPRVCRQWCYHPQRLRPVEFRGHAARNLQQWRTSHERQLLVWGLTHQLLIQHHVAIWTHQSLVVTPLCDLFVNRKRAFISKSVASPNRHRRTWPGLSASVWTMNLQRGLRFPSYSETCWV